MGKYLTLGCFITHMYGLGVARPQNSHFSLKSLNCLSGGVKR